ncbi:MAG TPA: serine/threonine protein kinase, partial [Steroidobacteraceae bacterium]|nr:serine/threonine protein kinase [Steroidobacteraceae bacterium]
MQEASLEHPYDSLTPDVIVGAVEAIAGYSDGRVLALGSYENRVYQVGLETGGFVVAKFYRPGRWTDAAILEEHAFAAELASEEIPVVSPLRLDGESLFEHCGFRYAVFPRQGGRWPELDTEGDRQWIGRVLGRIHMVGTRARFAHRPVLDVARFGDAPREYLLEHGFVPAHLEDAYATLTDDLLARIDTAFEATEGVRTLRLHGDCHRGNVLWTDEGPHFVDLDDCLTGPAIQDLWMMIAGDRDEMAAQLAGILEGYTAFAKFDPTELWLIEPLRTLRMVHYAGWLAARWSDTAFPRAFPWFAEPRYWENHVLELREQLALLDEGPLV